MALFGSATRADMVFADQFEATDDENFIYRQRQTGAPIKVSPWERDAFVESFMKARQRASWSLFTGAIVLAVVVAALFGRLNAAASNRIIYVGIGLEVVGFFIFWRWAWNAPARALRDRQPQGSALDKGEARRAALKRMSWGQFAWSGLVVVIGGVWIASKVDLLSGWNRLWLIGGALYVGLLTWRIWQKWQADRLPY